MNRPGPSQSYLEILSDDLFLKICLFTLHVSATSFAEEQSLLPIKALSSTSQSLRQRILGRTHPLPLGSTTTWIDIDSERFWSVILRHMDRGRFSCSNSDLIKCLDVGKMLLKLQDGFVIVTPRYFDTADEDLDILKELNKRTINVVGELKRKPFLFSRGVKPSQSKPIKQLLSDIVHPSMLKFHLPQRYSPNQNGRSFDV